MKYKRMKKLLVVEDEPRTLRVLQRTLKRRGYCVEATADACEAIRLGRTFRPHVLLTDWLLKGDKSGIDIATALRQDDPQLAIVFVTGLPITALKTVSQHLANCVFLEKPVRLHQIESALAQSMSHARDLPQPDCRDH